jgi:hypothetical protein
MRKFIAVPGLFAGLVLLSLPVESFAGVFLSINIAPPPLQVYQQPMCPTDGYLWTPGYWGYGNAGYYWIPGAWVAPPQAGYLWTPGYWGFSNGLYAFNSGYWGPTVGFYGGVNYGFGYGGTGFDGGRWQGGHFAYNTSVSRVNTTVIHNTYNQTVVNNNNRASFNGGPGGVGARPSSAEAATARAHNQPASMPATHEQAARPATAPVSASNRSAEPQSRNSTHATTPSAAKPEQQHQAAGTRPVPQQAQRAAPQEPRQEASNRSAAPSRPAQQQRPQATHAAAPERAAAKPEGKEERK